MRRILTMGERLKVQCRDTWRRLMASLTPATKRFFDDREVQKEPDEDSPETPQWHLVLAVVDGDPVLNSYASYEDLLEAVKTVVKEKKRNYFFAFYGRAFRSSNPEDWPLIYLEGPDGDVHPLYEVPRDLKLSTTGFLGPPRSPEIREALRFSPDRNSSEVREELSDEEDEEDEEEGEGEEVASEDDDEIREETE